MKPKSYRPLTLFLCFLLIVFILFSPYYIKRPKLEDLYDKIFTKNIEWRGIITLWDYPRLDITTGYKYSWLRDRIKEFERLNPGVIVEFETLDPQFGHIKIDTAAKTNSYPDIAPVGTDYELISKGLIEPLNKFISIEEEQAYKIQAITAVKYKDKIWGLPYMIEPYTLLINKEIFQQKGVALPQDGQWTYQEFINTLKELTDTSKNKEIYGFNSFIQTNHYNTWGIIMSDGAEIIDYNSHQYRFYDKRAISGLKKLVDLRNTYKVTPEAFGANTMDEAWESFIKGKIAVYPGKSSKINELRLLRNSGKGFDFDVANYPIGDLGIPISVGNSVEAFAVFKQDDPKKLEMCVKLVKYLTSDNFQKELYKQGVFPVKRGNSDIYKNDNIMKKVEKNISYIRNIGYHPNWKEIDEILQSQIRMALLGEKSPEEAIEEARTRIGSLGY